MACWLASGSVVTGTLTPPRRQQPRAAAASGRECPASAWYIRLDDGHETMKEPFPQVHAAQQEVRVRVLLAELRLHIERWRNFAADSTGEGSSSAEPPVQQVILISTASQMRGGRPQASRIALPMIGCHVSRMPEKAGPG